jgi:hypothetical protein
MSKENQSGQNSGDGSQGQQGGFKFTNRVCELWNRDANLQVSGSKYPRSL